MITYKGGIYLNIEDFVTLREAGKMLNINRARVGVLCRAGRFEGAVKIKLGWMIPRESVLNFKRLPPGLKPKTPRREDDEALLSDTLKIIKEGVSGDQQE